MFIPRSGRSYHCGTDTFIRVLKVHFVNHEKGYVKLKAAMVNKKNKIVYPIGMNTGWGVPACIKLELKNIQHWRLYEIGRQNYGHVK